MLTSTIPDSTAPVLISLSEVEKTYNDRTVLGNVNLDIHQGDFIAVTGPNGGGKTTLLRLILKLVAPTRGKVQYLGNFKIGYLPQKNMVDSRFPITVRDTIAMGLLGTGIKGSEASDAVNRMLHTVDLAAYADASLSQLSGGQLQRALLGRALVSEPDLLVLDEPLSYLDKKFERRVYEIVKSLKGRCTVILVSHEVSEIAAMATRHIIVNHALHFCHSGSHFVHYDCYDNH